MSTLIWIQWSFIRNRPKRRIVSPSLQVVRISQNAETQVNSLCQACILVTHSFLAVRTHERYITQLHIVSVSQQAISRRTSSSLLTTQQNRLYHIKKASIFIDIGTSRMRLQNFLLESLKCAIHFRKSEDVFIDTREEKTQCLERRMDEYLCTQSPLAALAQHIVGSKKGATASFSLESN